MSLRPKRITDFDGTVASFLTTVRVLYEARLQPLPLSSGPASQAHQQPGPTLFMDPFQQVYDLCTAYPKPLDARLFNAISAMLVSLAVLAKERILLCNDIVVAYSQEWITFRTASRYLDAICEYLNKITAMKITPSPLNNNSLSSASAHGAARRLASASRTGSVSAASPPVFERQKIAALAFLVWKTYVLVDIKRNHNNRLLAQIFHSVHHDRQGTPFVEASAIVTSVESFVEVNEYQPQHLSFYIDEFEKQYLEATRLYYLKESNKWISTLCISDFLKKVSQTLSEEDARNFRFCHPTSHKKVLRESENQCIASHKSRIYSEFETMLLNESFYDAKLAYLLILRIPDGITPILQIMQSHIMNLGKDVVDRLKSSAQKEPREFIQALIDLYGNFREKCSEYFNNDALFGEALDKAFRKVVNESYESAAQNFPELLSRFCDGLLKKNAKVSLTESEVEEKLNQVVILFSFLNEKDIFQKFYSRLLAKRLIYGLSVSDDLELSVIAGLKVCHREKVNIKPNIFQSFCGFEYTQKLQRMFTDVTLSSESNKEFLVGMDRQGISLGVEFSIMVLTAGSWPLTGSAVRLQLPEKLEHCVSRFTNFYMNKHSGRKLTWMYHLCKADVRLTYLDKKYELNISLQQLVLLLLFNDALTLKVSVIAELAQIDVADVHKLLKPLLDLEILRCGGNTSEPQAEVSVNLKFSNKRTKLKISAIAQSESVSHESEVTRQAVDEDRKLFLQLVPEVIEHARSRFVPNIAHIKKSIEQLIDKGYMERSKDRKDQYTYLA
ncbi:hypothetical protein HDU84_007628 [Entophlyctis sp. JEL0112]|nr:hypothetical protein HDU84_007628 [Entophlyctis sp. JEL0112]